MLRLLSAPSLLLAALGAQQPVAPGSVTRTVVDATGVYTVEQTGAAAAVGTTPAASPTGLRWTYADAGWITRSVSVGLGGTMAWLGNELNNQRMSLLSTTENNAPPATVFEVLTPGESPNVRAADDGSACAVVRRTGSVADVEYYTCFSQTPAWSVNYSSSMTGVEIAISDNGRYVAVGHSPAAMTAQIDVYDAQSGTPTVPIAMLTATTHTLRHLDISGDGSTVLMATQTDNHVFDVATQTEIFTDSSTVSHDAHAINGDGTVWGRGGFNPVRAWWKVGNTYQLVLDFTDNSLGFAVYTAADVSSDGSTFVAAAYDANNSARLRVYCWRLTPAGSTLLWTYASDGTGSLQTTPQAVSISDDGQLIAVGSWGDQNNVHPEVLVFARDVGNIPIASLDTPGSCFDLDLAGSGRFLVVGTKSVHANISGRGGAGYSFDMGGQNHWLQGTSSIGRPITLRTDGTAGEAVVMAFANGPGGPITLPGIGGSLQLNPLGLTAVLFVGNIPAGGSLSTGLNVPPVLALIGQTVWTQPLVGPPFRFENPLRLPITP